MNMRQPALLLALIYLAACGEVPAPGSAPAEPPLAGADIGGDFTLVGANGETVTNQDLRGRWQLVYFGYTFCPDVCPVDAERMGRAYAELEASDPALASELQPVFITVDPARDTPQVAQEFAGNFHEDMIGLSGSEAQVQAAADAYRVYSAKGEEREDGFYLMDHSAFIYLMDAEGRPVNFYARDMGAEAIAVDIRRWMTS